jgi:hypothetical protein
MECEFEERQFEQHLTNEMLLRNDLLYVPGQVLEGTLGFDAAMFSVNRRFWRHFDQDLGFPFFRSLRIRRQRPGVRPDTSWWRELDHAVDFFPRFRFNVFVQYKRPTYLKSTSAKQWGDWGRPYFRYVISLHQQRALEQLESRLADAAIVVYASPAFYRRDELWAAIGKSRLIEETNFCQPINLTGHAAYTYIESGSKGRAYSEPADVESFELKPRIKQLFEAVESPESNRRFLIQLGDTVHRVLSEHLQLRAAYEEILRTLVTQEDSEFVLALARVSAFNFLVGVHWTIAIS